MAAVPGRPKKVERWEAPTADLHTYPTEEAAYIAEAGAWLENELLGMARDEELREAGINTLHAGQVFAFILKRFTAEIIEITDTVRQIRERANG